jgi:hypothetical protein
VAAYAYREYTRKPKNAGELSVDYTLTADELVAGFAENEEAGIKKYNTKVIEVTGEVSSVTKNEKKTDVLLSTEDPLSGVNIQLIPDEGEKAQKLKEGMKVTIRGICTGKLSDVELNKGVIIKP